MWLAAGTAHRVWRRGVSVLQRTEGGEGRGKDSQALHSALDWRDKWGKSFPCTWPTRVQPSARHCVIPKFGREGPPSTPEYDPKPDGQALQATLVIKTRCKAIQSLALFYRWGN